MADQLSTLGIIPSAQATYAITRAAASDYILAHPDDFLPFLPSEIGEDAAGAGDPGLMSRAQFERYCATMRNTAIWGGEPEILALSRVYNVPIHVVQGGTSPVVVHEPSSGSGPTSGTKAVVYISYHRRLYGLGEVGSESINLFTYSGLTKTTSQHYNSLRPKTVLNTIKAAFR